MFGRRKENASVLTGLLERVDDIPVARLAPACATEFAAEYDQLATELEVQCFMGATGHRQRLMKVLHELNVSVYPLDAVERYLDKNGDWGWFPLRSGDRTDEKHTWVINRNDHKAPDSRFGYVSNNRYDAPVPFPVLGAVKDVIAALLKSGENGRVIFMVAALRANPDPFLGVRLLNDEDRRMIVIERWDEPGFRR